MKKYKLLKDLPGLRTCGKLTGFSLRLEHGETGITLDCMENLPEWFEEVKELEESCKICGPNCFLVTEECCCEPDEKPKQKPSEWIQEWREANAYSYMLGGSHVGAWPRKVEEGIIAFLDEHFKQ